MPMHNDWAREALNYTIKAITHIESGEQGLTQRHRLRKLLERPLLYMEHHQDTAEFESSDKVLFHKILLSATILSENTYTPEETLRRLKIQEVDLWEYLGESPAIHDQNQLKIDFDGTDKN